MGTNTGFKWHQSRDNLFNFRPAAEKEQRSEPAQLKDEISVILWQFHQAPEEFNIQVDPHEVVIAGPPLKLNLTTELILRLQGLVGDRQIHIEERSH